MKISLQTNTTRDARPSKHSQTAKSNSSLDEMTTSHAHTNYHQSCVCKKSSEIFTFFTEELVKASLIQMYTRRLPSLKPEASSEALTSSLPWRFFSQEYYGNLCNVKDPFNKNTIYSYAIRILGGVACLLCFRSLS